MTTARTKVYVQGLIIDGRLSLDDVAQAQFDRRLTYFGDGEEVMVTVESMRVSITKQARGYYFGVVLQLLADHTGHSIDDLHTWAKARFTPKHLALTNGNGHQVDDLVIGSTTTDLDTTEFAAFVEQIRAFMQAELNIPTPDPDPNWRAHRE